MLGSALFGSFNKSQKIISDMKIRILIISFFISQLSWSQSTFNETGDVVTYMDSKSFSNDDMGLLISYGYISKYNTYGIIVTNKLKITFYYINVIIDTYGTFSDLYGMSPDDGSNFGFRLFKGRLVVGYGEENPVTFYP
jgi:hypothetical protein